jgi:hypothetical protein
MIFSIKIEINYGGGTTTEEAERGRAGAHCRVRHSGIGQGKVATEESSPPRPKLPILVEGESEPSLREAARGGDDRRRLAEKVRRADKQDERRLDRYVFDAVLQCHELAEELQYLVGKKYIDGGGSLFSTISITIMNQGKDI